MTTEKYDLDLTDQGLAGWNTILKGSIEDIDGFLHTRILATLGETGAIGEVVYLKSDGKYWKAKAAAGMLPGRGVCLEVGNADDEIRIQRIGPCTVATWNFVGDKGKPVYLDADTAGALTETRPKAFAQTIGRIVDTDQLFLEVQPPSPIHYGVGAPPTPTNYEDGIVYFTLATTTTTTTTT
jgi:hypothetical protein